MNDWERITYMTTIRLYGGYVPDSDPKTNETLEYKVVSTAGGYTLQLASEEMPPLPPAPPGNDTPKPNPRPMPHDVVINESPLDALWCWLVGLFGGKC